MTFKDEAGEFWIEFWSLVPETKLKKYIMCVFILPLGRLEYQVDLMPAPISMLWYNFGQLLLLHC